MSDRLCSSSSLSSCDMVLIAQMAITSLLTEAPSFQEASCMAVSNRFTDLAVVCSAATTASDATSEVNVRRRQR
jgi:hypothetical protein